MLNSLFHQPGVHLEDVVSPRPVDRGLYLLPGGPAAVQEVENRLLDVLESEQDGPGIAFEASPAGLRPWRRPSRMGPIFWFDAGNEFHRVRFEIAARRRGMDAARALRAVRADAVRSLADLNERLTQLPNPALLAFGETESRALWWTPFVILTGVSELFPETLAHDVAEEQFHELTVRLAHLRRRAVVLVVGTPASAGPRQRLILQALARLGRRILAPREAVAA